MEWIDGVKLTDKPKMDAAGLSIIDFVDIGIECTLRQLLEHGYFHADPHPGTITMVTWQEKAGQHVLLSKWLEHH